jgi:hypothetical protein
MCVFMMADNEPDIDSILNLCNGFLSIKDLYIPKLFHDQWRQMERIKGCNEDKPGNKVYRIIDTRLSDGGPSSC